MGFHGRALGMTWGLGMAVAMAAACAAPEDPSIPNGAGILNQKTPSSTFGGAGGGGGASGDGGTSGGTTGTGACTAANYVPKPASCTTTWTANVYPIVQKSCATPTCHGGTQEPVISATDASAAWTALLNSKGTSVPNPYINPCSTDPTKSSFYGNVSGTVPAVMPLGPALSAADQATIQAWVTCGAQND